MDALEVQEPLSMPPQILRPRGARMTCSRCSERWGPVGILWVWGCHPARRRPFPRRVSEATRRHTRTGLLEHKTAANAGESVCSRHRAHDTRCACGHGVCLVLESKAAQMSPPEHLSYRGRRAVQGCLARPHSVCSLHGIGLPPCWLSHSLPIPARVTKQWASPSVSQNEEFDSRYQKKKGL